MHTVELGSILKPGHMLQPFVQVLADTFTLRENKRLSARQINLIRWTSALPVTDFSPELESLKTERRSSRVKGCFSFLFAVQTEKRHEQITMTQGGSTTEDTGVTSTGMEVNNMNNI